MGDQSAIDAIISDKMTENQEVDTNQSKLPIFSFADQLIRQITANPVTIVVGTTGCGKTTHIPAMLLKAGLLEDGEKIACTLPTRPATMMAARFVAKKTKESVGRTVGYAVRLEKKISPRTKILYLTDGMMLQRLHNDPLLKEFGIIMVDEVHERRQQTDLLLAYLKSLVILRPELRVVISSATMQTESFSRYFADAPVVNILTRQYPVKITHQQVRGSIFPAIANAVAKIHKRKPKGDILVFLPGLKEIQQAQGAISKRKLSQLICLPLHGRLTSEEQRLIFAKTKERKVILATNIAETSLTVPTVKYVIDTGTARENQYIADKGIHSLWIKPISQASAIQRVGRAGRTGPGTCIRLYSQRSYDARPAFTAPVVNREDITNLVLQMLARGIARPETVDLPTPLDKRKVELALQQLQQWGAVDQQGSLTDLGTNMARLPLNPQMARMVLLASQHNVAVEAADVAAFLSMRNITQREDGLHFNINGYHNRFRDPRGDALSFLRLRRAYNQYHRDEDWCRINHLDSRLMQYIYSIREQILQRLQNLGIKRSFGASLEEVHRILIRTMGGRLCAYHRQGMYCSGELYDIRISRDSSLADSEPVFLLAEDLLHIGVLIARHALAVPEDMVDEAIKLYGDPTEDKQAVTTDKAILKAKGGLRIQTRQGTRLVNLNLDCQRSPSRSLRLVKNKSFILEEDKFLVSRLGISTATQGQLAEHDIHSLKSLPKTEAGLKSLDLSEDDLQKILLQLDKLGYIPQPAKAKDTTEASALADGQPREEDWLVTGLVNGPIQNLQFPRNIEMRLISARIQTVESLIGLNTAQLRSICGKNEELVEEIQTRLEEFDLRIYSASKQRRQGILDAKLLEIDDVDSVDPEISRGVLGDEIFELFEQYVHSTSFEERTVARNRIIMLNDRLHNKVAWTYMSILEKSEDKALEWVDLRQEGVFGSITAINKFKYLSGYRYSTVAVHWIRQAITRMLQTQGVIHLPVHIIEKIKSLQKAVKNLQEKKDRTPTTEELAEKLKCKPEYVVYLYSLWSLSSRSVHLQDEIGNNDKGGEQTTVEESLFKPEDIYELQLIKAEREQELRKKINNVLREQGIPDIAIKTIRMLWGADGDDPMCAREVGRALGITGKNVIKIENEVVTKLRTPEVWEKFRQAAPWLKAGSKPTKKSQASDSDRPSIIHREARLDLAVDMLEQESLDVSSVSALDLKVFRLRHQGMTLDDVGKQFGVTRERVRQRQVRAENKLLDLVEKHKKSSEGGEPNQTLEPGDDHADQR